MKKSCATHNGTDAGETATNAAAFTARRAGNIEFRKAALEDIPIIRGMADIVFRSTYAEILSPEQMEYMMDRMYSEDSLKGQIAGQGKEFLIIEAGGIPAGYVSFEQESVLGDGRKLFHLQKLYVMAEFRKKGLGRAAVEHVLKMLRQSEPDGFRVELNVNRQNPATGFYEKLGMRRVREGDFPIGGGFYMNDYIYALDFPASY